MSYRLDNNGTYTYVFDFTLKEKKRGIPSKQIDRLVQNAERNRNQRVRC